MYILLHGHGIYTWNVAARTLHLRKNVIILLIYDILLLCPFSGFFMS